MSSGGDVSTNAPAAGVDLDLPSDTSAMRTARQAIHELLTTAPIQFVSDALLLTSEVVTNAVLHAKGPVRMQARFDSGPCHLVVRVMDHTPDLPVLPATASPWSTGGRGLTIVDRIAQSWGATPNDEGKAVWFELSRAV